MILIIFNFASFLCLPFQIHYLNHLKNTLGTSLVAQWLGICLAVRGTLVQSLVGN